MRSTDHSLLLTIILRNVRNDLQTALFFYLRPAGRLSAEVGCCCELTRRLRGLGVVPSVGVDFDTCRWGGACHREE